MKKPEIAIKLLESVGERLAAIENLAQNLSTNDVVWQHTLFLVPMIGSNEKTGQL